MGMMCKSIKEEELGHFTKDYIAERKYDGSRIIYRNGRFFTQDRFSLKDSRDVTFKFPELKHNPINAVLDGEIVAESGSFEDTGSRIHLKDKLAIKISATHNPVVYWIFDIIEIDGESVKHLPLYQRKELLKTIEFDNPRFELVEATEDVNGLWEKVKAENGEGIILKHRTSAYENRRSNSWLKCKYWKEDVVLIDGYTENPKGIRLEIAGSGQGIQCAGGQSIPVREALDERGKIRIEIQYLSYDKSADGKDRKVYRFPSFKRMVTSSE